VAGRGVQPRGVHPAQQLLLQVRPHQVRPFHRPQVVLEVEGAKYTRVRCACVTAQSSVLRSIPARHRQVKTHADNDNTGRMVRSQRNADRVLGMSFRMVRSSVGTALWLG